MRFIAFYASFGDKELAPGKNRILDMMCLWSIPAVYSFQKPRSRLHTKRKLGGSLWGEKQAVFKNKK